MKNYSSALIASVSVVATLVSGPVLSAEAVLDEIIVTAQRRAENLQDVNLAISAYTQSDLDRMGANNVERLDLVTPGLQFGQYGAGTTLTIRGLGRPGGFEINTDGSVGFFIDGVYRGRGQQTWVAMVDAERVEVTRGPQGTLYGRNTTGGNINVVTNKPGEEFEFFGDVMYGNYDQTMARATVNLPLSETTQTRFNVFYQKHDGFVENINPNGTDLADEDQTYVNGSVRFAPNEDFELILRGHYWEQGGNGNQFSGQKLRNLPGVNPTNFFFPGTVPGQVNSVVEFVDTVFGSFVFGLVPPPSLGASGLTPGRPAEGLPANDLDPWLIDEEFPSSRDVEEWGVTAHLNWDFGRVRLTSITGYNDYVQFAEGSFDFSPIAGWEGLLFNDVKTFSQEFHLSSQTDGPLEWLLGLYYLDDDLEEVFANTLLSFPDGPICGTPCLPDPRIIALGSRATTGLSLNYRDARATTKSTAIFGQASYDLTDRFRITGGIRYTEDDKTYDQVDDLAAGISLANKSQTFSKTTWLAGVDYSFTDDSSVYFAASTGFKSGIYNRYVNTLPGQPEFATPELVDNYAFGSKNRFLGDRLQVNAELFWNDITDAHAYVFDTLAVTSVITNAGLASTKGAEIELVAAPTAELYVTATLAYLDAVYDVYKDFTEGTPGNVIDASGNKRELSPEWTASFTAAYDINMGDRGVLTPYVQWAYKDDYFITALNDPILDHQDAFTQTDIKLYWQSAGGHWNAEAFIQNIEDNGPLNGGFYAFLGMWTASGPEPRTYGFRLGYRY